MPSGYERWTSQIRLQPRMDRRIIAGLCLLVVLSVVALLVLDRSGAWGIPAGIVAVLAMLTLVAIYLAIYLEIVARVHRSMLRHGRWRDAARLGILFAALVGGIVVILRSPCWRAWAALPRAAG